MLKTLGVCHSMEYLFHRTTPKRSELLIAARNVLRGGATRSAQVYDLVARSNKIQTSITPAGGMAYLFDMSVFIL